VYVGRIPREVLLRLDRKGFLEEVREKKGEGAYDTEGENDSS